MSLMAEVAEKAAALNAERLARKEGKDLVGKKHPIEPLRSWPVEVVQTKGDILAQYLEKQGCACLRGVLSSETVDKVLNHINEESDRAKVAVSNGSEEFGDRFGGVNCRGINGLFGNRQDFFLSMQEPVVVEGLQEAVKSMAPFLHSLVGHDAMLHEISSIVSDPASPRQCIHADTIHLPCPQYPSVSMPPLYTFFIALQDISDDMGHTTFLPQTHTEQAHLLWNSGPRQKEIFITTCKAEISSLKKGDVAIFDSRLLHAGGANTSNHRRVLFYFTASAGQRWPLPNGLHGSNSVRKADQWNYQLCDLGL